MPEVFYNKDKKIKIYQIISNRDSQGFITTIKRYIHPVNSYLCAYFKDLRSAEIAANRQVEDDTEAQFLINRRAVSKDMFIEFKRRTFGMTTYQITGIDGYEDNSNELKLSVKKINSIPKYDIIEGTDWKK